MGRGEPTLVPEWYRLAKGGATANNANSKHQKEFSSHSDENGIGFSSRSRLSLSACYRDAPCSLDFTDRSSLSSARRSSSTNGFMRHDRDGSAHSRPYCSFGRREWKKDLNLHDRDRPLLADIGSRDHRDSFVASRTEKDSLQESYSEFSARRGELWPKRLGNDSNSCLLSGETVISGIRKASFERNFPSLGAEEKQDLSDTGRVSSPGLSTAVPSLPIGASSIIGGDGWTSALAEVPAVVGVNGSVLSSAAQTAPVSPVFAATNISAGLNMAEALAQAPSPVRSARQLPVDTHRTDKFTLRQCKQLIPVTPSMPKTSGLNSSEKPKFNGARGGDFGGLPKGGQQLSQLLVINNALRAPAARSDVPKASQAGNFQVLNRERNGIFSCSAAKDVGGPGGVLKKPIINANLKAECKGTTSTNFLSFSKQNLRSFGEKRPLYQAQNRNDFFNSLRNKNSVNHSSGAVPEPSCCVVASEKSLSLGEQNSGTCADASVINQEQDSRGLEFNGNGSVGRSGDGDDVCCEEGQQERRFLSSENDGENSKPSCCPDCNHHYHLAVDLDEKEAAFLRSLGWEEDAGEEALTVEEIADFIKEYEKLRPSSKLSHRS